VSEPEPHPRSESSIGGVSVASLTRLFATIVQQSQDAIVVCDQTGTITQWNQVATGLYGYTAAEAIGRSPNFLVPEGHGREAEELTADARDGQHFQQYMSTRQRKDGRLVEVSLTISPIVTDGGQVLGTVALARDISTMMRIQAQLTESERRMNEAQTLAHVGSWDWDLILEFPTWTEELCRIYGYPIDHMPSGEDLFSRVHLDDRDLLIEKIREAKSGVDNSVSYRIALPTGELRYVDARHHARFDEDGEPMEVHGIVLDVTERQHYEEELQRLATHDSLTGLPNRRTFDQRFELELARCRRDGIPLSLAVIDIDKFKRINDTFGHQEGDHVLSRIGALFAKQVREDELLARVGGEEFGWILHGADADGAWVAVERARALIGSEVFREVGRVTISAGICTLRPEMDQAELYRAADLALLEAKRSGRDRVIIAPHADLPLDLNARVA
jgi:diguanylate cyclase (GGDEF)-like protein/PAS domain S-box-containing protein